MGKKKQSDKSTSPKEPEVPSRRSSLSNPDTAPTTPPRLKEPEVSLPQSSLRLLGADRDKHLSRLGIRNLRGLLDFEPLQLARFLLAVSRGLVPVPQMEHFVKEEFVFREPRDAITLPVAALRNVTEDQAQILVGIGVRTIGDLTQLGQEADKKVLENNGFSERPSAPAQLLPGLLGSVASSVRFTTFIRDVDLRKLKLSVDPDCVIALPLSGSLTNIDPKQASDLLEDFFKNPDPNLELRKIYERLEKLMKEGGSLSNIFENQKCPVIHLGYICEHRQRWINLGTNLGEVVHSVSLAPGESRNIALVNWRRRQLTALEEHTTTSERLTATFVQNRAFEEITSAVAREHQFGQTQTESNTAATATSFVGAGAAVGGIAVGATGAVIGGVIGSVVEPGLGTAIGAVAGGAVGAAVGGAAGAAAGGLVYTGSQVLGMIEADTEGNRKIAADVQQRIALSTSQTASAVRSLWSTVVVEDTQAESVEATTSNITNYNHMHALNIEYYEVLQHYLTRIELGRVQPILFLPFTFFDFTGFRFVRDYWDVVRLYIDDEGLRAQGDAYFVTEGPPELPDRLPVPPVPVPPGTQQSPILKNLRIDVLFKTLLLPTTIDLGVMQGNTEISASNTDGVPGNDLDGYDWGNRYTFDDIPDAQEISAVNLSRNQFPFNVEVKYRIRVNRGRLFSDNNELDNLKGQGIASNKIIRVDDSRQTFTIPWKPAADFQAEDAQDLEEYKKACVERAKVLAKNQARLAAYEVLVENTERFKQRLQRLILRRRHFFTRVILNAIEPEEMTQLLEAIKIGHAEASDSNLGIPLSEIANTIPLGMTAGALVLKLKRLDEEKSQKLSKSLGINMEELKTLLEYSNKTITFLEEFKKSDEMVQTDHVYVPTGGLFAEAILGQANSAEYLNMERYFNWQDSPIPHQAPPIQPVGTESRFQQGEVNVNVPEGNLQVINPVNLPDPTGLQGVLTAIQNPNLFRDMSKATEMAGIIGSLSTLAGQMGQAASTMTGQAAQQALQAATEVSKAAAGMAQSMMSEAFTQAGGAFNTLTSQGAALNQAAKIDETHATTASDSGLDTTEDSGTTSEAPPSLQEETFRRMTGVDGSGVVFANLPQSSAEAITDGSASLIGDPEGSIDLSQTMKSYIDGLSKCDGGSCVAASLLYFTEACKAIGSATVTVSTLDGDFEVPSIAGLNGANIPARNLLILWFSSSTAKIWPKLPRKCRSAGAPGALLYADLVENREIKSSATGWPSGLTAGAILQLWRSEEEYRELRDNRIKPSLGHSCVFHKYKDSNTIVISDQMELAYEVTYPFLGLRYVLAANLSRARLQGISI